MRLRTLSGLLRSAGPGLFAAIVVSHLSGCATAKPPPSVQNDSGLNLTVAFVYQEKVYAAGAAFSLAECFAEYAFPVIGGVFKETRSYPDQWEALKSEDVDLIALMETIVHGSAEQHKFSMALRLMTRDEKTIFTKSIQQETGSLEQCPQIMPGMATQLKEAIETSARVKTYAEKRAVF